MDMLALLSSFLISLFSIKTESKSIENPQVLAASTESQSTLDKFTFNVQSPAFFFDTVTFSKNIVAPNIISVLRAGDGISISGNKITSTITQGLTSLTAGTNISIDGNKITNTYTAPTPDYTLSGWNDTGTVIKLTTLTDSVELESLTAGAITADSLTTSGLALAGGLTVTSGNSLMPETDLGSDIGNSTHRFNSLWVASINSNSSQAFSGQTIFSHEPLTTALTEAPVLINPTKVDVANGQLLGLAVGGYQKALIDEDGDIILGYSDATSAPVTDYPLNIYGHSGTRVSLIDTSGNGYFAGNVGIGTTAPSYPLDVYAPSGSSLRSSVGAFTLIHSLGGWNSLALSGNGMYSAGSTLGLYAGTDVQIGAGGTNQNITLTPSGTGYTILNGNVGIGTTAPVTKLDVYDYDAFDQSRGIIKAKDRYYTFYIGGNKTMTTSEFAIQAGAGEMQLKNGNATAITLANPNAGQFMSFGNIQTGLGGFSALGYMYHASTDETAYQLNYTTNKAAGNDTGLLIAMTDTASPGTSLGLNYTVGGVNKFNVDNSGQGYFAGNVGIGTTAPANKLDVNGGLALGTYAGSAGIANGLVVSGSVGVGTTNAFTYTKMVVGGYPVDAGFGYPLLQVGDAYNANATYSIGFGLRAVGDFAPAEIGYKALSNTPGTYGALVFGTRSVTTGSVAVSERMRIDENGNVGIGTTAPATPLHVSTSTGITIGTNTNTSDGTLKIGSAKLTTNTSGDITWNTSYAGNAPADVLKFGSIAYSLGSIRSGANALALSGAFVAETINSSTVNPVLLHISGGSGTGAGDSLVFNNVSSGAGNGIGSSLFFKSNNANGNNRSLGRISSLFSNATQGSEVGDLVFITARTNDANSTTLTEAMRIQGGNVGIGTTAPTNRLHIVSDSTSTAGLMVTGGGSVGSAATGNGQILLGSTATAQGRLSYENAATANLYLDNSWNNDAGNIYLRTKSSSAPVYALTILGSGNVGIGTTAPASPLDIGGKIQLNTASASNGLYFTYNAGNTGQPNYHLMGGSAGSEGSIIMYDGSANFIINHQHSSAGMFKIQQGGVDKIVMDRSGNLGIGTTAPAYALDVKATGTGVIARFNSDNTAGCTIADGGTISCSSDRNLKKNILGLSYGLEDVMKLNPVVFNWNFDDEIKNKSLGFIAQDVEAVIPSLVTIDSNGMKSLNTIGLIPVLTKAIQEQEIKILAFINQIKDKFTTKELCLGENGNETCVTKQELDELIKFLPTTTPSSTSIPTATPEVTATPSATPLSTAEPSPTPISNEI